MSFAAWIKWETTTSDKEEVVEIARLLAPRHPAFKDHDLAAGKLARLWSWADQNSADGTALKITRHFIDRLVACKGFAHAMETVGWLEGGDGAINFPHFERHNGDSAKRRATETRRKQDQRDRGKPGPKPGTNVPPPRGTNCAPEIDEEEIEKESARIRGEIKTLSPKWAGLTTPFGATEEAQLRLNLPTLRAWDRPTWDLVRRFLAARLPEGSGVWQPRHLRKLLDSCSETEAQARAWDLKQQHRQPPKPPAAAPTPDPADTLDPEAAIAFLRSKDPAA